LSTTLSYLFSIAPLQVFFLLHRVDYL